MINKRNVLAKVTITTSIFVLALFLGFLNYINLKIAKYGNTEKQIDNYIREIENSSNFLYEPFTIKEEMPKELERLIVLSQDPIFWERKTYAFMGIPLNFINYETEDFSSPISRAIVSGTATNTNSFSHSDYKQKLFIGTFQLEYQYEKKEILNMYINYVSYGNTIDNQTLVGINSAGKYYFEKELDQLTSAELIVLMTIRTSPILYSPDSTEFDLDKFYRRSDYLVDVYTSGSEKYTSTKNADAIKDEVRQIINELVVKN